MAEYISFQPSDFFNTKLYTGTGSSNAVTGVGFEPAFTWIKNRDDTDYHILTDAVRGVTKQLFSNVNSAEATQANNINSFDSDGFTVGTEGQVNMNTEDFVSWNWKAGTTSGIAGSPSITPTSYSFNATPGFSIIKWTGTGANATLPHGLGVAPKMIIVKNLDGLNRSWRVYNSVLGATKYLYLAETNAEATDSTVWNDTEPTSTLFSVGTNNETNESADNIIAYCFAEIKGYSKFGSYVGNGATDGPFVYTGFRPAYLMIKSYSGTTMDWKIIDNKRSPFNVASISLRANGTHADTTIYNICDFTANGFKIRSDRDEYNGSSSYKYIYMAFAEFPIVSSNDVPTIAR